MIEKGTAQYIRNGNIVSVHWRDKRDVYVMSALHGNGSQLVERRAAPEPIRKPDMIVEYNKYMNGVDKCDQFLNYYSVGRKFIKWWKKVFFMQWCCTFPPTQHFLKKRQAHKLF